MASLKVKDDYQIGIITALPIERAAITAMLDERHTAPTDFIQHPQDSNSYTWGSIGSHHVVMASLSTGVYGNTSATTTVIPMIYAFPNMKWGLMVGIGAGVPSHERDIRLGDVAVSQPMDSSGGVFQYDLGKLIDDDDEWKRIDWLSRPPDILLKALGNLQAEHEFQGSSKAQQHLLNALERYPEWAKSFAPPQVEADHLFVPSYSHQRSNKNCALCDPAKLVHRAPRETSAFHIHYGVIASGNSLVKHAKIREKISQMEDQCICIEMEAAGLMNNFPCLVIRGICDYADTHKNDMWQRYASATAAAFAKELLTFTSEIGSARRHQTHHIPVLSLNGTLETDKMALNPVDIAVTDSSTSVTSWRSNTIRPVISPASHQVIVAQKDDKIEGSDKTDPIVVTTKDNHENKPKNTPWTQVEDSILANKVVTPYETCRDDTTEPIFESCVQSSHQANGLYTTKEKGKIIEPLPEPGPEKVQVRGLSSTIVHATSMIAPASVRSNTPSSMASSKKFASSNTGKNQDELTEVPQIGMPDDQRSPETRDIVETSTVSNIQIENKQLTPKQESLLRGIRQRLKLRDDEELSKKVDQSLNGYDRHNKHTVQISLLHEAARQGDWQMAEILIQHGALVDIEFDNSGTPLIFATTYGHNKVIEILLNNGADIDHILGDGSMPLHLACLYGHIETARQLLDRGANIHADNRSGKAPLHYAVEKNFVSIVELLLNRGIDIHVKNRKRMTALHYAAKYSYASVRLLLDRGADIDAKDNSSSTALHYAIEFSRDSAKLLLDRGANINAKDKWKKTPLHYAIDLDRAITALLLLERGANVDARDFSQRTPLHYAQTSNVVRVLLAKGADIRAVDKHGKRPIDLKKKEVRRLLAPYLGWPLGSFLEKYFKPGDSRTSRK